MWNFAFSDGHQRMLRSPGLKHSGGVESLLRDGQIPLRCLTQNSRSNLWWAVKKLAKNGFLQKSPDEGVLCENFAFCDGDQRMLRTPCGKHPGAFESLLPGSQIPFRCLIQNSRSNLWWAVKKWVGNAFLRKGPDEGVPCGILHFMTATKGCSGGDVGSTLGALKA